MCGIINQCWANSPVPNSNSIQFIFMNYLIQFKFNSNSIHQNLNSSNFNSNSIHQNCNSSNCNSNSIHDFFNSANGNSNSIHP